MIPVPDGVVGELMIEKYFEIEPWQKEVNTNQTATMKAMSDYTGVDFLRLDDLPYAVYMLYRHDAWVANMSQSEEGREFIKACARLQKTTADSDAIRRFNEERGR